LEDAAERAGLSTDELLEIGVPTCGLDETGVFEQTVGEITARIEIGINGAPVLLWRRLDGVVQTTVPMQLKTTFPSELQSLKARIKELSTLVPAQKARIESMLMTLREIPIDKFVKYYLNHGLVRHVTNKLIWSFGNAEDVWTSGIFHEGRFIDSLSEVIDLTSITKVRIWHPLGQNPISVLAWRESLARLEITQPFKQAHREIYLLTDAEEQTSTYSNRFASHILKQHQFAALCKDRNWSYSLQGAWDSSNTPTLSLRREQMTVEFDVEPHWESEEMTPACIYLYVFTDQVRFLQQGRPIQLDQVPPLIFSEVMRDVDLFVGVASVGTDPAWLDTGPAEGRNYWVSFAHGELAVSAEARKGVLASLIPKLRIRDRLSIQGNYLHVRGDVRSYKIHIGSGNILMSPNDQYLCIVLGRSQEKNLPVLPFEGDQTLALIISKALLLADDTKISDPAILSQLSFHSRP
jgi:Domain of unknown function (DUF4132)